MIPERARCDAGDHLDGPVWILPRQPQGCRCQGPVGRGPLQLSGLYPVEDVRRVGFAARQQQGEYGGGIAGLGGAGLSRKHLLAQQRDVAQEQPVLLRALVRVRNTLQERLRGLGIPQRVRGAILSHGLGDRSQRTGGVRWPSHACHQVASSLWVKAQQGE